MGLRPPELVDPRPDHSTGIVGEEGLKVRQDTDGTQIQRLGIPGADADWGPEQLDIDGDGEEKIAAPEGVGGTRSSSGIVNSIDDRDCSVVYVWKDPDSSYDSVQEARDSEQAVIQEPDAIQTDTEHTIQSINTKSDNCEVWVVNESADTNTIEFTLNFH